MPYQSISRGPHTWPIVHDYHACEKCGKVIESRERFAYRMGKYEKDIECPRCQHKFTLSKKSAPTLGPLWNT